MNEYGILVMSGAPFKPRTEAALAKDSVLYRWSVACLKGAPELLHFNDDVHFLLPGFDFTNIMKVGHFTSQMKKIFSEGRKYAKEDTRLRQCV